MQKHSSLFQNKALKIPLLVKITKSLPPTKTGGTDSCFLRLLAIRGSETHLDGIRLFTKGNS